MSLPKKLLNHLRANDYTSLDTCYKIGERYKQETVSRALRKICNETEIEPVFKRHYIVGYQKKAIQADSSVLEPKKVNMHEQTLERLKQPRMFDLPNKRHYDY